MVNKTVGSVLSRAKVNHKDLIGQAEVMRAGRILPRPRVKPEDRISSIRFWTIGGRVSDDALT
jgi:hypothetical protein